MCVFNLPLLLLDRLRLFTVAPTVSGMWLRFLLLLFVLFSLRIDDFDSVNGGGTFVDSDVVGTNGGTVVMVAALAGMALTTATAVDVVAAATVAICEFTFHGHANGGAFDTVSCKLNKEKKKNSTNIEFNSISIDQNIIWPNRNCKAIVCVNSKVSVFCIWLGSVLVYFYCVGCCCYCWVPDDSVSRILAHSNDAANHYLTLDYRVNRDLMHLHWMSHWNRLCSMSPHHYIPQK